MLETLKKFAVEFPSLEFIPQFKEMTKLMQKGLTDE